MSVTETTFTAPDGWPLAGLFEFPDGDRPAPTVVAVAGSRHERDAWHTTAAALAERGVASLRFDIRGRGTSLGSVAYARMGPRERRRVSDDVRAALDHAAAHEAVDGDRLALLTEQDTAADAVEAAVSDPRATAIALLSARHPARLAAALDGAERPVLGMVSTEDREGLRATVDAYLAGDPDTSRLEVYRGLGIGITMSSVLQFEQPDAEPIEARIANWFAARLDRA